MEDEQQSSNDKPETPLVYGLTTTLVEEY